MTFLPISIKIGNKFHLYFRTSYTWFGVGCQRTICQLIITTALQRLLFVIIPKTRIIIPCSLPFDILNYVLLFFIYKLSFSLIFATSLCCEKLSSDRSTKMFMPI